MLNLLKILCVLIFLNQTNAQVKLNRTNIAALCVCYPPDVTEINLSYKNIVSIDSITFNGLTSLKSLILYGNRLTSLSSAVFSGLSSLSRLDLDKPYIYRITILQNYIQALSVT